MSADILLDQAIAFVRRSFSKTELKTVELYGGEFSAEEIPQKAFTCPAVFITVLGWQEPPEGARLTGRHAKQYRLVAFVVDKHANRIKRMTATLALAEKLGVALCQWAPMREPGNAQLAATIAGLDGETRCDNLYNRAVDKAGMALFALSWYQCAKPEVPVNADRPAVAYEDMQELKTVAIEDTVHVAGGPVPEVPTNPPLAVTEKIDFVNP